MKSNCNKVLLALSILCITWAGCGRQESEGIVFKRLALFIADAHIQTDKTDYIVIVQPDICVSCVGYYLHTISSKIPASKNLLVICSKKKQNEVAACIDHDQTKYCSDFDDADLKREPFLASGIGYAKLHDGKLMDVVSVNKSVLTKLLNGMN
ncbi:MAG: hypothetical protein EOO01_13320 [Chitinophagaceae bacterium]|nr:MAG: hypothetical protein EOO01_13320 [Chitinophagaceae bacterium]